jgi:MoxR-like ATPase
VSSTASAGDVENLRNAARAVRVDPRVIAYITDIVRATRAAASLTLGASPRAGVALLKTARVLALLQERDFVIPDDVKALAPASLRHRVAVAPELELEGVTADDALRSILESVEAPTL